ncbi:unnamed protein product, partial [Ixodes hexagonus]
SSSSRSSASVGELSFELSQLEPFWVRFLSSTASSDRWRPTSEGGRSTELPSASPEDVPQPQDDDVVLDSLLVAGLSGLFSSTPVSPGYSDDEENEELPDGRALADNACFKELSSQKELRALARRDVARVSSSEVGRALLLEHALLGPQFLSRLRRFQRELNSRGPAWDTLNVEQDPVILAGLLWFWLDKLREPVLSTHHLTAVVVRPDDPISVLLKLDRVSNRDISKGCTVFVNRAGGPLHHRVPGALRLPATASNGPGAALRATAPHLGAVPPGSANRRRAPAGAFRMAQDA